MQYIYLNSPFTINKMALFFICINLNYAFYLLYKLIDLSNYIIK